MSETARALKSEPNVDNFGDSAKLSGDQLATLTRQINNKCTLEKQKTTTETVPLSKLWTFADRSDRCKLYVGWFACLSTGLGLPATIVVTGDIFESYNPNQSREEGFEQMKFIFILISSINLYTWISTWLRYAMIVPFQENVIRKTRIKYLEAVLRQDISWFDQTSYQELSSLMAQQTDVMKRAIGEKFADLLQACGFMLASCVVAFLRGWNFTLTLIVASPIFIVPMLSYMKVAKAEYLVKLGAYGQSAGYAEQALNAIKVVEAFSMEEREALNYSKYLEISRKVGVKSAFKQAVFQTCFSSCFYWYYCYMFTMAAVFIREMIHNPLYDRPYSAGDIMTCFFGMIFGIMSLGQLSPQIAEMGRGKTSGKLAFDTIERIPQINQDANQNKKHNIKGRIEFKNVDFYYPSRPEQKVLDNFSAVFEEGKTTALVGPSGSGKSTIVQLIERFYDADQGQVLIDGIDIKDVNLRNLRQQIGYVSQEPVLFNTTLKKNIQMCKPDATDEEIITALKSCNAWEFVKNKEEKIDMMVGSSGNQLSGGQKQRVALARSFIKKPKLMLFDEATSALDRKNEQEVQKAIEQIRKDLGQVTNVVIAHRLTTIRDADQILVMKKGKIVERGNHEELLKNYPNGTYAKFVNDQQNAQNGDEEQADGPVEINVDFNQADMSALANNEPVEKEQDSKPKRTNTIQKKVVESEVNMFDQSHESHASLSSEIRISKNDVKVSIQSEDEVNDLEPTNKPQVSKKASSYQPSDREKEIIAKAEEIDKKNEEEKKQREEREKKLDSYFGLQKRVKPYTNPTWATVLAGFSGLLCSFGLPILGIIVINNVFALMLPDVEQAADRVFMNVLYLFSYSIFNWIFTYISRVAFSYVTENMTKSLRIGFYSSVLKKAIGWHELRENSAGALTPILASEIQTMNGVGSESLVVMLEAAAGLGFGIIMSAFFCWQITLIGIGIVPILVIANNIASRAYYQDMKGSKQAKDANEADVLASDTILNHKTVASFGYDNIILEQYNQYMLSGIKKKIRASHREGIANGFSQFIKNVIFMGIYISGTYLTLKNPDLRPEDVMQGIWCLLLGAFQCSSIVSQGPDVKRAKAGGSRVFDVIENTTKINAVDIEKDAIQANESTFNGTIEFVDVWFRYPSRPKEWVFKGLNIKIEKNECVAIVGESGCGKSTFINLVMRFYDPEFGKVLIDGVDIKTYDLKSLRQRTGLVMQEPILFNYSIMDNILYGNNFASNQEIEEAAMIANAIEFIQSNELSNTFEDKADVLLQAMIDNKDLLAQEMGAQKYSEKLAILEKLAIAAKSQFKGVKGELDQRTNAQKGEAIHHGFDTMCGNKGGKLSGGQKQRIAIARAVIRKPQILLLDEATSALDEASQRKVQNALDKIMVGRTSLVIAHRLTTVEKCSRVAVIENGQIVESGSFESLKNQEGGYFANLAQGMKKTENALQKQAKKLTEKQAE